MPDETKGQGYELLAQCLNGDASLLHCAASRISKWLKTEGSEAQELTRRQSTHTGPRMMLRRSNVGMSAFRVIAVVLSLVMLIGGTVISCLWLKIEGTFQIPIAAAVLAALGAAVLFLELQDERSA
jgi:hypothetical protein